MIHEYIKKIETKYKLNTVEYENIHVWLNIKNHFISKKFQRNNSNIDLSKGNLIKLVWSIFKNFHKWFLKYDYWFIGDSLDRKKAGDKYYNIFLDFPATKLTKVLFIELPIYSHRKNKDIPTENLVSKSLLIVFETLYTKIFLRNIKISNISEIEKLVQNENVELDIQSISKKMIAQHKIMSFLLKVKKPKTVFLTTSYSNYGYIKALKEKKVTVIEFQHGVINKEHYGYNLFLPFDANYFPDKLLTFGNQEQEVFTGGNLWIKKENVFPIGSFFIEYSINNYEENNELNKIISNYNKTISVSLQDCNIGESLIEKLIESAIATPKILYLLKPRRQEKKNYLSKYKFPDNIIFIDNLDVYQTIMQSDFHLTAYSSCVLEAPAMGVKNIIFNLENKGKEYYNNILAPSTTTYVESVAELVQEINAASIIKKNRIKENHKQVIVPNYKDRITSFLSNKSI